MSRRPVRELPPPRTHGIHGHPMAAKVRWLVGRPYNGRPTTDATWSKAGTGHYNPDQAGWWARQNFRRRMAIIWSAILGPPALAVGYWLNPLAVRGVVWLATWFGIIWLVWTVRYETLRWAPRKKWVEPIHQAIHEDLGIPRKRRAADYIHVPRGGEHITDPDKPITVELPDGYHIPEGDKRRAELAHKVAENGGIMIRDQQFEGRFELDTDPRTLTVWCNPQPPEFVAFSEIINDWLAAAPHELVIGKEYTKAPVKPSLAGDAAHVLVNAGPGGGKTELLANLALQRRVKVGARAVIVDCIKRGASAKWAKDIEGIEVIRQVDVAYRFFLNLFDEVQRRCEGYWHHGYDENQQEIDVFVDEANQTFNALREYEKQLRADDKEAPSAIEAYEGVLHVGREADTHLFVFGQRGSARGTGGSDAREAFGIIIANRFTQRTARMLFADVGDGTTKALPRSSNHPGRVQVVTGGTAVEAQVPLVIDRRTKQLLPEPLKLATERIKSVTEPARPGLSPVHDIGDTGGVGVLERPAESTVVEAELVAETPVEPELVDLAEAARRLKGRHPNATQTALQNYRNRDSEFPTYRRQGGRAGQTYFYDLAEIDRFLANRPRAGGR